MGVVSYDQTFKGRFTYADAHCLEAAIDAFLERDPDDDEASVLELDDLKIDGLSISIDWDGSAPASSSFGSEAWLRALAEHALSGTMKTSFTMDTTERTTVSARKRKSAAGLPPRHHRWEIYAAAKAGDAKRLRALKARLDGRVLEGGWQAEGEEEAQVEQLVAMC